MDAVLDVAAIVEILQGAWALKSAAQKKKDREKEATENTPPLSEKLSR